MFYGIGHTPNSGFFASQVETDGEGYVVVRGEGVATSVEGVFSAGDLHDKEWCQAVTAAGSGCMAAISAERYLGAKGLLVEKQSQSKAQSEQLAAEQLAASVKTKLHTAAGGAAAAADVVEEDSLSFDASRVRHKGQFALRKLYHESDRVLMVMYSGPNCGPCKRLKPMLDGVLDEYGADVHFVEIDIEVDQEIAKAAGVVGTPCVQVFKDKQRIEVLNGVKMKKAYREVIDGAMGVLPAKEEVNA
jgi:thioredoxin reductase (NADPH)